MIADFRFNLQQFHATPQTYFSILHQSISLKHLIDRLVQRGQISNEDDQSTNSQRATQNVLCAKVDNGCGTSRDQKADAACVDCLKHVDLQSLVETLAARSDKLLIRLRLARKRLYYMNCR